MSDQENTATDETTGSALSPVTSSTRRATTDAAVDQEPMVEIHINGSVITLLGTAHVSKASADKVTELIRSGDYNSVAVELCKSRHNSIIDPDAFANMDLFQVIREGKATMVAANLALGAFQQRMAEQLDIKPGAEMRAAIDTAAELELPVILIDREIATTLKRVYRNVPWWQRMNIMTGLIASVVSRHEVTAEEIERLKEGDILESTFTQFAEEQQDLFLPLVDERDRYMAARLLQETVLQKDSEIPARILVVIGAGHMSGMKAYLEHWAGEKTTQTVSPEEPVQVSLALEDAASAATTAKAAAGSERVFHYDDPFVGADTMLENLDRIPAASRWPKLIPWFIVALVFVGFGIGFSRSSDLGWELVIEWVVINGGLAALGALIALAHPVTIVAAFVAAPLTSLNPAIGAGMVTAAVETMMRRPTVENFSQLRTDTTRLKGWWQNRVTRILLVFLLSTLGSAAGTYIAGFRIFGRLAS